MDAGTSDDLDAMTGDPSDGADDHEPLPDCRAEPSAPMRSARWAAVRGARQKGALPSVFLVSVAESGPGELHEVGPAAMGGTGMWSADGAFFAFATRNDSGTTDGYAVVDVRSGDAPVVREVKTVYQFAGWAPHGHRYLELRGGDAAIIDAADPESARAVDLPSGSYWKAAWSPDARFIAMTADGDSHVYVFDTESAEPSAQAYGAGAKIAQGVHWAPTGHRLVYSWWNGVVAGPHHLVLIDLDEPSPVAVVIAEVGRVSGVEPAHWLDADRMLALTAGGQLGIWDVTESAASPEVVATFAASAHFRVTNGGRCTIFAGPCGGDGKRAACVVSLDRGGNRQPRQILGHDEFGTLLPHSGSPAVLIAGADVVVVPLDGRGDAPMIVNTRAPLDDISYTVSAGESGAFIYYRAAPSGETAQQSHFWSTRSHQTFTLQEPGRLAFISSSPDGHLYALANDRLLLVHLDDVAQPRLWWLELSVTTSALSTQVMWQP